jgi:RND superfamily putative drug exporter
MSAAGGPQPGFARFVRRFAVPIIVAWLLVTVAVNVFVPPIESVARNHAVTMSPQDAPAMIAAKRIGATFHESNSDSVAMIVVEGRERLGEAAHHFYNQLIEKLRADHTHVQHVQDVWGDPPPAPPHPALLRQTATPLPGHSWQCDRRQTAARYPPG